MDAVLKGMSLGFLFIVVLMAGGAAGAQERNEGRTVFATQLLDRDVYDENGNVIGDVDDLVIRRSGRIERMTVEFGGFLGIAEKLVALPFKRYRIENGRIVADAAEEQIRNRPEYDYYSHWRRPAYRQRLRGWSKSFRSPGPEPGAYYEPHFIKPTVSDFAQASSPARFLASEILDAALYNELAREIGRLKDLIIDIEKNRVVSIVLSSPEILGRDVHATLPYEPLGFTQWGLVYDVMPGELVRSINPYSP